MRIDGKVAIVTGAGNGIGRATALRLARAGGKVLVADVEADSAEETAGLIRSQGGDAMASLTDVGVTADLKAMVRRAVEAYGRVDILHNNAYWLALKDAVEHTEEEWDRTMAVCLKATWYTSKLAIPEMLRAGGGAIVNTASVHSLIGFPKYPGYDAAKAAICGLTRQLAAEYGPRGIRVNAVLPGGIDTRAWASAGQTEKDAFAATVPLRRLGRPEEIASAVLFLVSDDASYVNGASLIVDGGWSTSA
jgi:NAD(P)-dependent dehydrogenase (short-subunit alcohol dehydrogenase family)